MNAPFLPPTTAAIYAARIAKARELHDATGNLLAALTRSAGKYSTAALRAEIAAWEAVRTLAETDNLDEAISNLKSELPDEPYGQRFEFDASGSHPDRPGGW